MPDPPVSPSDVSQSHTSIGFGGGEAVVVCMDMDETRKVVQEGLSTLTLIEIEIIGKETVVINPTQVVILQKGEVPDA